MMTPSVLREVPAHAMAHALVQGVVAFGSAVGFSLLSWSWWALVPIGIALGVFGTLAVQAVARWWREYRQVRDAVLKWGPPTSESKKNTQTSESLE